VSNIEPPRIAIADVVNVVVAFLVAVAIALGTAAGVGNPVAVVVVPTLAWLGVSGCDGQVIVCS